MERPTRRPDGPSLAPQRRDRRAVRKGQKVFFIEGRAVLAVRSRSVPHAKTLLEHAEHLREVEPDLDLRSWASRALQDAAKTYGAVEAPGGSR